MDAFDSHIICADCLEQLFEAQSIQ